MGTDIAVLTIHGMGDQGPRYDTPLIEELEKRLGTAKELVHFFSLYYQSVLRFNQDEVISNMSPHVRWRKAREFLLYAISDATSIESKKEVDNSIYDQVQEKIVTELDEVYDLFGGNEVPVVIVADSLGGQVISNYLWDSGWSPSGPQTAKVGIWSDPGNKDEPIGSPRDRFRRLRSLRALITTGCNIPLFVAGHDKIVAIKPPHDDFEWRNYYDLDDVLGWPLAPLSSSYQTLVDDYPIGVGLTPLSHLNYWGDRDFLRPLADFLLEMATA